MWKFWIFFEKPLLFAKWLQSRTSSLQSYITPVQTNSDRWGEKIKRMVGSDSTTNFHQTNSDIFNQSTISCNPCHRSISNLSQLIWIHVYINQLKKNGFQVSWIRKSDSAILSVDDMLVCIIIMVIGQYFNTIILLSYIILYNIILYQSFFTRWPTQIGSLFRKLSIWPSGVSA